MGIIDREKLPKLSNRELRTSAEVMGLMVAGSAWMVVDPSYLSEASPFSLINPGSTRAGGIALGLMFTWGLANVAFEALRRRRTRDITR